MNTKTTLYLDSKMYKALKLRAVQSGQSVSALMNEAMQSQLAEDMEDISAIRHRQDANEEPLSYENALAELRKNGSI